MENREALSQLSKESKALIHPRYWSIDSLIRKALKDGFMFPIDLALYVQYLGVKDKTVLDIGAKNFDSAQVFLSNGAKKVICVEKDFHRIPKSIEDKIEVYNEWFNPKKHLSLDYDVCKMDIEGYEILAAPFLSYMKRSIAEVHNCYMIDLFKRSGWKPYHYLRKDLALMVNQ